MGYSSSGFSFLLPVATFGAFLSLVVEFWFLFPSESQPQFFTDTENEGSGSCCLWQGWVCSPDLSAAGPELCPLEWPILSCCVVQSIFKRKHYKCHRMLLSGTGGFYHWIGISFHLRQCNDYSTLRDSLNQRHSNIVAEQVSIPFQVVTLGGFMEC